MRPLLQKLVKNNCFTWQVEVLTLKKAISLIINGFVKDVFVHLPMEFAVEASQLLGLKLEGSVG